MEEKQKELKELGCKDFKSECDFSIRAEKEEEILDRCQEHACSVHGKCDDSPNTRERIRSRIRTVQV